MRAALLATVALLAAAPAGAVVLPITSTDDQVAELTAPAGTAARLQGVILGLALGSLLPNPAEAVVVARIEFTTFGGPGTQSYDLAPVSATIGINAVSFVADVDLTLPWGGFTSFSVRPDFVFAQGANPFSSTYTSAVSFQGTLTVSDSPSDVPEPGSLALLGMGLAGLATIRRRAA